MKGGDRLPAYGEFVTYKMGNRMYVGVSNGASNPDKGEISVYIPENDNFEIMTFPDVRGLYSYERIPYARKIAEIKRNPAFREKFNDIPNAGGKRTRKRKLKNKSTRKR